MKKYEHTITCEVQYNQKFLKFFTKTNKETFTIRYMSEKKIIPRSYIDKKSKEILNKVGIHKYWYYIISYNIFLNK